MTPSSEKRERAIAALRLGKAAQMLAHEAHRASNPWGLSRMEELSMRKIVELGCHKLAARELNLETRTVSGHAQAAGKKMGHRTSLMRYLEFDRWIREKSE